MIGIDLRKTPTVLLVPGLADSNAYAQACAWLEDQREAGSKVLRLSDRMWVVDNQAVILALPCDQALREGAPTTVYMMPFSLSRQQMYRTALREIRQRHTVTDYLARAPRPTLTEEEML